MKEQNPLVAIGLSCNREGRKIEQKKFAAWSDEKKAAQTAAANYSPSYVGAGDAARTGIERTQPVQPTLPAFTNYSAPFVGAGDAARTGIEQTQPAQTQPTPSAQSTQRGDLTSVGEMYGLLPNVGEVDQKAKTAQSQAAVAPAASSASEKSQAQTKAFTTKGQAEAEIPANRFSAFDATLLPGQQAKTGMVPIPSSVNVSLENPLAATPLGAYTNNWNLKTAGAPAASVFAGMDDETLSRLIGDYADYRKKQNLDTPGVTSYGERTQSLPALKDALGSAYDTLYPVALSMVCPRPKFEIPEDSSALLPDDNSESAGHTVHFPSTVSFPNFDELWGFPGHAGNSAASDNSENSAGETDDGQSKEISIDLDIENHNQHRLDETLKIGDEATGQSAREIGCLSVAIAEALGISPKDFIENLNANGGYNSDNLLNWNKVEELYGYDLENESGGFEDTKESIVNYLEAGIPVIGQIRRSGGGYHYFLITGFDGTVGKNTDGSYDLSNVTMDMFTVNDPQDGTSKTLTQAVGANNFNAIAVYIPPKGDKGSRGQINRDTGGTYEQKKNYLICVGTVPFCRMCGFSHRRG